MLKNKTKFVVILALILVLFCSHFSLAAESNGSDTMPISIDTTDIDTPAVTAQENIKKGDEYLVGQDVTVDYTIDGNLYVFGNTVTINSQIVGDVFVFANQVVVEKDGYIYSNLFACAQSVTVKGVVYDAYICTNNFTISGGYVYRDSRIAANTVNISGVVGRNAYISCDTLSFGSNNADANSENTTDSKGIINGNLEYSAKNEASIPNGCVTGETKFTLIEINNYVSIGDYVSSLASFLCLVIFIWLLLLWLSPKFLGQTNKLLKTKKSSIALYGILGLILIPIVSVLLMFSGIASNVGLLLLALCIILLCVSKTFFTIAINKLVCAKLKIKKTGATFGILLVSSIVIWAVGLIPYVGSILSFIMIWIGLGVVLAYVIPSHSKTFKTKEAKNAISDNSGDNAEKKEQK